MPATRVSTHRAIRALVHPVSIVAIALLLLNDHVLKDTYPGLITGKLSDFAGLAFFPLILAAGIGLLGRGPRSSINSATIITGVWFTSIKTVPIAAASTESLVRAVTGSSHITVDPWDLIALPALAVPWLLFGCAPARGSRQRPSAARGRIELALLGLAAFASMATSCEEWGGISDLAPDGTQVEGGHYYSTYFYEHDGETDDAPHRHAEEACLPDGTCFRIDGGAYVLESTDGVTWTTAWEFPEGRLEFVSRYGACDPYDVTSLDIASTGGSDPSILVAMADDGVLERHPDGTWERDILGHAMPLAERGANIGQERRFILGMALLLFGLALVATKRIVVSEARFGRFVWLGLLVLGATGAFLMISGNGEDDLGMIQIVAIPPAILGTAGLTAGWAKLRKNRPKTATRIALLSTLLIAAASWIASRPFLSWSDGSIPRLSTARAEAIAILLICIALLALVIGYRRIRADDIAQPLGSDSTADTSPSAVATATPQKTHTLLAALFLTLGLVVLPQGLFLTPLSVGLAAFLAARFSGHQLPFTQMLVAIGLALLTIPFSSDLGWIVPVWLITVVSIRVPQALAWAGRLLVLVATVATHTAVTQSGGYGFGHVNLVIAGLIPWLVIAVDRIAVWWANRREGQPDQSETESTTS